MKLEERKEPKGNWKFLIMVTIAINMIFLAVVIFVVCKIAKRLEFKLKQDSDEQWGHTEKRYYDK